MDKKALDVFFDIDKKKEEERNMFIKVFDSIHNNTMYEFKAYVHCVDGNTYVGDIIGAYEDGYLLQEMKEVPHHHHIAFDKIVDVELVMDKDHYY